MLKNNIKKSKRMSKKIETKKSMQNQIKWSVLLAGLTTIAQYND